ncbi:hypothetical protein J6590_068130, partial [Homalodisca vitripennis]
MASFYSLLEFLAVNIVQRDSFDMLSWLPSEMAVEVFRLLPEEDLLNAACVSRSWLKICKSDKTIRHRIRRYLRHLRTKRLAAIMVDNSGRNRNGLLSNRPPMMIIKNTFQEYPRFVGKAASRRDLLNAACVSRSWLKICKSDKAIRHRIRRYLRHLRTKRLAAIMVDNSGRNRNGLLSNRPPVMIIKNTFQEYPRLSAASRKNLLNAACVSRSWLNICKSDKAIRHRIRRYLRHLRTKGLAAIMVNNSGRNRNGLLSNRPPAASRKRSLECGMCEQELVENLQEIRRYLRHLRTKRLAAIMVDNSGRNQNGLLSNRPPIGCKILTVQPRSLHQIKKEEITQRPGSSLASQT